MDRGPGRFRVPSGPPGGRQGGDRASGRQLLRHAQKPYRPQAAVVPRGLARGRQVGQQPRSAERAHTGPRSEHSSSGSSACPCPRTWRTNLESQAFFFFSLSYEPVNSFILFCRLTFHSALEVDLVRRADKWQVSPREGPTGGATCSPGLFSRSGLEVCLLPPPDPPPSTPTKKKKCLGGNSKGIIQIFSQ